MHWVLMTISNVIASSYTTEYTRGEQAGDAGVGPWS
jgi:hypothetical protein